MFELPSSAFVRDFYSSRTLSRNLANQMPQFQQQLLTFECRANPTQMVFVMPFCFRNVPIPSSKFDRINSGGGSAAKGAGCTLQGNVNPLFNQRSEIGSAYRPEH